MVTWRNSSSTERESGCGFHPSFSSGNKVSFAITRILSCSDFHVLNVVCSQVGGACCAAAGVSPASVTNATASAHCLMEVSCPCLTGGRVHLLLLGPVSAGARHLRRRGAARR